MQDALKTFLLRWLVNFLGLFAATALLKGVATYDDKVAVLVWAALIFSLVNAFIRPLLVILSLPAIVVTLGLFTFVINTLMLYLVAFLYPKLQVASFGSALLAVIIIWFVNFLLNDLLEAKES